MSGLSFLQDFSPEALLLLGAAVCAGRDLGSARGRRLPQGRFIALAALVLAFLASVGFWHSSFGARPPDIEHGSLVVDRFALFFYATTLAAAGALLLCGADAEPELEPHLGVFQALLLVACAGVLITASSTDLVTLGAGLALTGLPLALAGGLRKTDAAALRVAARSLSLGGLALVLFLLGAAALAGLSGATGLRPLAGGLHHLDPLLILAALLVLLGGLAQLGAFPYVWWRERQARELPGLPLLAAVLLGALAGGAALLRVLPGALGAWPQSWALAAAVMAALTLVVAPWLAWRSRQLGLVALLLVIGQLALVPATLPQISQRGTAAILYLLLCTVPLAAGLLGLMAGLATRGVTTSLVGLRGIWQRSPLLAAGLCLLLAGLAGLPPLAGFMARLVVVDSALHAGYGWLAWLELLSAVASALVALRWLLVIFDLRTEGPELAPPQPSVRVGVLLCAGAVCGFGILVGPLFAIASRAGLAPLIGP
ncbi:MAG: proton-conducting transporter membrane subunit [Candidatus Dormibacteria bacterium]